MGSITYEDHVLNSNLVDLALQEEKAQTVNDFTRTTESTEQDAGSRLRLISILAISILSDVELSTALSADIHAAQGLALAVTPCLDLRDTVRGRVPVKTSMLLVLVDLAELAAVGAVAVVELYGLDLLFGSPDLDARHDSAVEVLGVAVGTTALAADVLDVLPWTLRAVVGGGEPEEKSGGAKEERPGVEEHGEGWNGEKTWRLNEWKC